MCGVFEPCACDADLAIGADIGHFHASCDGAAFGDTTHRDFRLFCSLVKEMNGGGVYLNYGSAVVLPEIFLKAVSVVRNLGTDLLTSRPLILISSRAIGHRQTLCGDRLPAERDADLPSRAITN